ncbi:MAG: MATE family efflux transporter [bacterium]
MNSAYTNKVTFKSLLKFALPNIIMMVFLSLYVIIDGIFISSKVNEDALGGVNIAYPIVSLMFGISIMIASGGGALISKKLGEGKDEEARKNFSTLVLLEVIVGGLFFITGLLFADDIVRILGGSMASEVQLSYAAKYLKVVLMFAPALFLQCAFQTFFLTVGKPVIGMGAVICAGIANIVLDFVFIVVLGMGIEGAALATSLGQCIPAVTGVIYFFVVRTGRIYFVAPKFDFKMIGKSCTNGSSEMMSNLSNAVTTFIFNIVFLRIYGDFGTSAITIVLYFQFIIIAIFFGYTNGVSPIISYKYGEKKTSDIKEILKKSLQIISVLSVVMFIVSLLIGKFVISAFTNVGTEVFDIAYDGLFYFVPAFLFSGFTILITGFFTSLNNGLISGVISTLRSLVFLSLSIIICSSLFGGAGAFGSVAVAEFLGLCVAVIFLIKNKKKYGY